MSLASERGGHRPVVIALASRGNNYGVLSGYTAGLEAEFRQRGWAVTLADAGRADFLSTLLRHAADPEAVGLLGHFFYDLKVSAQNHFNSTRIGDLFRGRLCAMLADHPYTSFMWPRLQDADPRVVYCPADPGFIDAARFINPQLERFHPLCLPVLYAASAPPLPMAQRPIDVLIPLTYRDTGTRETYLASLATQPALRRLAELLFARLRDDRAVYPFATFLDTMQADFSIGPTALKASIQALREWLGVLSKVDLIVRNERRVELTVDLLRDAAGLRVHVVGKLPADLNLPVGTVCEGPLSADELGRRMSLAKWVVHCHPTYPQAMHERVLTAMASGCAVISDFAPALADAFKVGTEWLHAPPLASLAEVLEGVDATRLGGIGAAATRAVQERFSMTQHVDDLLAGLDAHGQR
jgi:hypothetical protein